MAKKQASGGGVISWERFRGRNGVDDPAMLPPDMGTEAVNWVINAQGLGERRRGTKDAGITGPFSGYGSLTRFVPGQDDAAAQVVFNTFDLPSKFFVVTPTSAPAATELTQTDALVGNKCAVSYAAGNGKLFIAYRSTANNRLHVYRPGTTGATLPLAGLSVPAGVTLANEGAGSYPPVLRFYRAQLRAAGGAVSALGAAASITPSGTGAAIRVTVTTLENATQWRVFGSADGVRYSQLNDWTLFTTTNVWDDSRLVPTYASLPAAPLEGSRYPLPSARFLLWDGIHLLLFGTFGDQAGNDLPAVPGRVYITQALDATADGGEDESIVMSQEFKGYVDLNRNGNAEDRAICGPIDGNILVFQSRGIFLLKPTGSATRPYARIVLSRELGAVSHWSCFVGEDEAGRPAIYFLDPSRGPYRYGYNGFEWLGYDVQDLWRDVNLAAGDVLGPAVGGTVACGTYDPRVRRCYWWMATTTYPVIVSHATMLLTFQVQEGRPTPTQGVRYGWTRGTGLGAQCYCAAMLPETLGNPMARELKPHLGYGHSVLAQFDAPDANTDAYPPLAPGTHAFAASVRSKAWLLSALPQIVSLERAWIRAPTSDAVVAQALIRNHGDDDDVRSFVELHPEGIETRRVFLFEDAMLAGAWTFQTQLGDPEPADQHYAIDRWDARMTTSDLEAGSSPL